MKTIFKAAKGSMFSHEQAQIYGEELYRLREGNGDVLTPNQVVEKARVKSSSLHDYFEWNDAVASQKYRVWQARHLLGHIEIIIVQGGKKEQTRAFHNILVEIDEEKERGYVTIKEIRENRDYMDIVLEKAIKEIESWTERYEQYKRLSKFKVFRPVFKAAKQAIRAAA